MLRIWNRRPLEIGAIVDMRGKASYGLLLKSVAERGEQNRHVKISQNSLLEKLKRREQECFERTELVRSEGGMKL